MLKKTAIFFTLIFTLMACSSGEDVPDRTSTLDETTPVKDTPDIVKAEPEPLEDELSKKEQQSEQEHKDDEEKEVAPKKSEHTLISPSTGLKIEEGSYPHFAAVIENSIQARPQSGLSQADLVFEMKTEGDISRYIAFFHDDIPERVGPVRSARHYFLPLANMLHTSFIHYGGSPQAYERLATTATSHIDGMTNDNVFSRDRNRQAPHNAYLYPERLSLGSQEKFQPYWQYSTDKPSTNMEAKDISFSYNDFTAVQYKWDEEKERYIRYQEGTPQQDRETNRYIYADNIIFLEAEHTSIPGDTSNRIDIRLSGEGKATILSQGTLLEGAWKNENGKLLIIDEYNKTVQLTPGKTWVQIIEPGTPITVH
ncbi:DUF3048 domain-containing protein [Alteribacillus iranensis]|uniref:DUF3048 domain-containing protein n=1 Tax=Alteribacillus iranensis TaxID=930128 RepID=A0A1I2DT99_9BACI|nr:DUF3048 domain-containing protein [Alteribacillus iranensis]SFE83629.1 Protein of unknown function [Alteribacillus iranensis]